MAAKLYNVRNITIVFAGYLLGGNYSDGGAVEVEFNDDAYKLKMSSDGVGTRSATNNQSATIRIKLMQTSSDNTVLSGIHNGDLLSSNGAGVGPLLIKNLEGVEILSCESAWIRKAPSITFDAEAGERVWELETDKLTFTI